MAQDTKKKRGRSSGNSILLTLLLILVGAAGAVGTLYVLGKDRLFGGPKSVQAREREREEEDHTGKVAVPISARPIEAYAAVQNEDLIDPRIKDFAVRWVDAEKAKQSGFLTDVTALRARVLARDKSAGYAFQEKDFLPVGTRPGPAAAIEKGARGVWIEPDQVQGLDDLRRGDRFDLMAMVKLSSPGGGSDARFQTPDALAAQADGKAWKTSKRLLVNDGKVIVPLPVDPLRRKGRKIFVQVAEAEVEPLSDALAVRAEIVSYLRSGQPGAGDSSLPEPARPIAMETIEVMQGGKKTTVQVPAGGSDDAVEDPK
jgi:hypothetical protein